MSRNSLRIPVSVVLERRIARVGPWSQAQWEAVAAVAGEEVVGERGTATLVHEDDECRRYLWPGLVIELFPDGCESYWYNLLSERPTLFVVCFERDEEDDDEIELVPALVTASQDEANAAPGIRRPGLLGADARKGGPVGGALRRRELRAGGQEEAQAPGLGGGHGEIGT